MSRHTELQNRFKKTLTAVPLDEEAVWTTLSNLKREREQEGLTLNGCKISFEEHEFSISHTALAILEDPVRSGKSKEEGRALFEKVISWLGRHEYDLNVRNDSDWSLMDWAACEGDIPMISCLMNSGANINATNQMGWSPISTAIQYKQTEVVLFLLDQGARANDHYDQNGQKMPSLLHLAALSGSEEILKALISNTKTKNIDEQDHRLKTPLNNAVTLGWVRGAEMLIEAGAQMDQGVADPQTSCNLLHDILHQKESSISIAMLKVFLKRWPDLDLNGPVISPNGMTASTFPINLNQEETFRFILDYLEQQGAFDPEGAVARNAVRMSISNNRLWPLKILVERGVHPDLQIFEEPQKPKAIAFAKMYGRMEILSYLEEVLCVQQEKDFLNQQTLSVRAGSTEEELARQDIKRNTNRL